MTWLRRALCIVVLSLAAAAPVGAAAATDHGLAE